MPHSKDHSNKTLNPRIQAANTSCNCSNSQLPVCTCVCVVMDAACTNLYHVSVLNTMYDL